jgi:hypothetical protein
MAGSEAKPEPESEPRPVKSGPVAGAEAVHALALLQREGRLVDFLMENIDVYDDAQVGAAVRQVHAGCRKAMTKHFRLEPVMPVDEGSQTTVEPGFDPSAVRLTGSVSGDPPFRGVVRHRGWRAVSVELPTRSEKLDPAIVCPAEVEL